MCSGKLITNNSACMPGVKRGYYLFVKHNEKLIWFAESKMEAGQKLESICSKYLTDKNYQYSVYYSYGLDINGRISWANCGDVSETILG